MKPWTATSAVEADESCDRILPSPNGILNTLPMDWIFQNQFIILLMILLAGLGILGWQVWDTRKKVLALYGARRDDFDPHTELPQRLLYAEGQIDALHPRIEDLETVGRAAVQKVGFVRFNPFQDMGGDNSFVLALLDSEDSGVLISSLYTREGARLYGKRIEQGGTKYSLTEEEKQVLEETMKKAYR